MSDIIQSGNSQIENRTCGSCGEPCNNSGEFCYCAKCDYERKNLPPILVDKHGGSLPNVRSLPYFIKRYNAELIYEGVHGNVYLYTMDSEINTMLLFVKEGKGYQMLARNVDQLHPDVASRVRKRLNSGDV